MKNILNAFIFSLLLISCQSNDDNSSDNTKLINSTIMVNGVAFVPNEIKVVNGINNSEGEGSLNFTLKNTSIEEEIGVRIEFPLTSSSAPNGIYDFGIGEIGKMLFAQGYYSKGLSSYGLAGYTVQVTSLGNNKFKLEFQNVQAVKYNDNSIALITGYCEGNF